RRGGGGRQLHRRRGRDDHAPARAEPTGGVAGARARRAGLRPGAARRPAHHARAGRPPPRPGRRRAHRPPARRRPRAGAQRRPRSAARPRRPAGAGPAAAAAARARGLARAARRRPRRPRGGARARGRAAGAAAGRARPRPGARAARRREPARPAARPAAPPRAAAPLRGRARRPAAAAHPGRGRRPARARPAHPARARRGSRRRPRRHRAAARRGVDGGPRARRRARVRRGRGRTSGAAVPAPRARRRPRLPAAGGTRAPRRSDRRGRPCGRARPARRRRRRRGRGGGRMTVVGGSVEALQVAHEVLDRWQALGLRGARLARDLGTGEELGFAVDHPFPLASVVKLPQVLVVEDRIARGELDGARQVRLDVDSRTPGPTGVARFRHPASVAVDDLAYLATAFSDNAASDALFTLVPPEEVTSRLHAWGYEDIVVRHPMRALYDAVARWSDNDMRLALRMAAAATTSGGGHTLPVLDVSSGNVGTARALVALLADVWTDAV